MSSVNKIYLFCITAATLLFVGCQATKHTTDTDKLAVPARFSANDSTASQSLTKQLIFTDSALNKLLDIAVKQNPDVLIAMQRIQVAKANLKLRKGALLPTVEAAAAASANKYGKYTMEGVGNFDTNLSGNIDEDQKAPYPLTPNYFLGFRSNWEIDLWGKLRKQKHAAYLRLLGSGQGRRLVTTTLVAEVASRYYELLTLDASVVVIKQNIALQDSAVLIAEVQKEAGRTTELGVQQFKAQLLRSRSFLATAEQDIVRVENELNYLLGRFPQPIVRTAGFAAITPPVPHIVGDAGAVLNNRPDVVRAELELKASKADVGAAKAALLPALTFSPFVGYSSFNSALLFNPGSLAYGLIGGLAGPVLNRTAITSNISRAEAEKQEARYQYYKTVLDAYREIETTLNSLRKLREVYGFNSEEASVLTDAVSTSNELYKVGYATYLEVIAAQGNAIEAQINALETKKKMYYSLIDLYRSIGGGW